MSLLGRARIVVNYWELLELFPNRTYREIIGADKLLDLRLTLNLQYSHSEF